MKQETITEAIEKGPEAVEKLIQAETDRRVNQARETWEKDLPDLVNAEIQQREEKEKELANKRLEISEEIQARFGDWIDADTWGTLVDVDGLISLEGEERTEAITKEVSRVTGAIDRVLKRKFSGNKPDAGDDPDSYHGTQATDVARAALGI